MCGYPLKKALEMDQKQKRGEKMKSGHFWYSMKKVDKKWGVFGSASCIFSRSILKEKKYKNKIMQKETNENKKENYMRKHESCQKNIYIYILTFPFSLSSYLNLLVFGFFFFKFQKILAWFYFYFFEVKFAISHFDTHML